MFPAYTPEQAMLVDFETVVAFLGSDRRVSEYRHRFNKIEKWMEQQPK